MLRSQIGTTFLPTRNLTPAEWVIAPGQTPYPDALATMEARASAIANGEAGEMVWLVEHPPLYTAGTSAQIEDLVDPSRFPVFNAGRGGEYTYHGPGQRVVYVMLDLRSRRRDVRAFVAALKNGSFVRWRLQCARRTPGRPSRRGWCGRIARHHSTAVRPKTRLPPSAYACANG
jgi:hypothetical protein